MNNLENDVLKAVDIDGLVSTLCELIAFESCHGRETPVQRHMAGLLGELGLETDVWEIDINSLKQHASYSAEIERKQALGVVGRWGAGRGRSLILNGHVDVVPAGEPSRWTVPPFIGTRRDGRIYGRGSADMKGGLSCALYAVKALRDAGVTLDGTVIIQSVVGEEDGGMGTLAAVLRGRTADAAIVLEPTELIVAPAQAGALSFRVRIPGQAAHGALRTEGINPIEKLEHIYGALEALERNRNQRLNHPLYAEYKIPFAICVGRLHAGIWASTVPENLVLEGRYGIGVGENCSQAQTELESAIAGAALRDEWLRDHPPVVEWWGARYEPAAIPPDHPLVTTLADSFAAVAGRKPLIRGMPYGADMHLLVNQGNTPTVIFGPGDVRTAHAPDEFVSIAELQAATRTLVITIMRFCGVAS